MRKSDLMSVVVKEADKETQKMLKNNNSGTLYFIV